MLFFFFKRTCINAICCYTYITQRTVYSHTCIQHACTQVDAPICAHKWLWWNVDIDSSSFEQSVHRSSYKWAYPIRRLWLALWNSARWKDVKFVEDHARTMMIGCEERMTGAALACMIRSLAPRGQAHNGLIGGMVWTYNY